jgi:hypothetical protein
MTSVKESFATRFFSRFTNIPSSVLLGLFTDTTYRQAVMTHQQPIEDASFFYLWDRCVVRSGNSAAHATELVNRELSHEQRVHVLKGERRSGVISTLLASNLLTRDEALLLTVKNAGAGLSSALWDEWRDDDEVMAHLLPSLGYPCRSTAVLCSNRTVSSDEEVIRLVVGTFSTVLGENENYNKANVNALRSLVEQRPDLIGHLLEESPGTELRIACAASRHISDPALAREILRRVGVSYLHSSIVATLLGNPVVSPEVARELEFPLASGRGASSVGITSGDYANLTDDSQISYVVSHCLLAGSIPHYWDALAIAKNRGLTTGQAEMLYRAFAKKRFREVLRSWRCDEARERLTALYPHLVEVGSSYPVEYSPREVRAVAVDGHVYRPLILKLDSGELTLRELLTRGSDVYDSTYLTERLGVDVSRWRRLLDMLDAAPLDTPLRDVVRTVIAVAG